MSSQKLDKTANHPPTPQLTACEIIPATFSHPPPPHRGESNFKSYVTGFLRN